MPAYRSSAEAEIRDAVVERLRSIRPASRIIHEINVSGQGSNRIDLIAVGEAEIIAVEVKSQKDKLDRLPKQVEAMRGAAHHAVVALHEKFLVEKKTNEWVAHFHRGAEFFRRDTPDEVKEASAVWVYPEVKRASGGYDELCPWRAPTDPVQVTLPYNALWMLWRDELYELCGTLRVPVPRRATMQLMVNTLRWYAPGGALSKGICAALRARKCIEADPEIVRAA